MKIFSTILLSLLCFVNYAQETLGYELIKLNATINDRYNQLSPVISPDGKTLYYSVSNHPENTYGTEGSQDIWKSTLDEKGDWNKGEHLGSPFNQNKINQVFNFLSDGSLFVRGGKSKNSSGFSIINSSGKRTELRVADFDKMNKGASYGATLSDDGQYMILYFSEKVGDRSNDLYLSKSQPNGRFSKPEKLKISSTATDFAPFIGPDQKTLYLSTNRYNKARVGGIDIYRSTRLDDTWESWSDIVNLGREINTLAEDANFSIDSKGNVYTARAVDGRNFDLMMLKPRNPNLIIAGTIINKKTNQPINGASVEIKSKDQKNPILLASSAIGKFDSKLLEVNGFTISSKANGFVTASKYFKVPKLEHDTITTMPVEIYLIPAAKRLVGTAINKITKQPISGVTLEVKYKDQIQPVLFTSSANGKFNVNLPEVDDITITSRANGFAIANNIIRISKSEQRDTSAMRVEIYLIPNAKQLVGTVVNKFTRQPIKGVSVEMKYKNQKKPFLLTTSNNGKFDTKIPEAEGIFISSKVKGYIPAISYYRVPKLLDDTAAMRIQIYLVPVGKQLIVTGDVIDKKTNNRVSTSKIDIILKENSTSYFPTSDGGTFSQNLPSIGWYIFNVSAEGYINAVDSVRIGDEKITTIRKNIYMATVEVGSTFKIKNINFNTDKNSIKKESFIELNRVVEFLKRNHTVSLEIASYADTKETDGSYTLSPGRTQSVIDYLISQSIATARLKARSNNSKTKPKGTSNTDNGRNSNRRVVEFTVLKK